MLAGKTTCVRYCWLKTIVLTKPAKNYIQCLLFRSATRTNTSAQKNMKKDKKGLSYLPPVGLYQILVVKSQEFHHPDMKHTHCMVPNMCFHPPFNQDFWGCLT